MTVKIPTPADVEKRRSHNLTPQIQRLTRLAADLLNETVAYPVSVPVRGEHVYAIDAITAVVAAVTARGWAVTYKPGDNMLMIEPAP